MRSLTPAEAIVIQSILASQNVSEISRIRRSGVARRTYQVIRRRVFLDGWVRERYIPNPCYFGVNAIDFVLAQPFADHLQEEARTWETDSQASVVWASPEFLFGVFFGAKDRDKAGGVETRFVHPENYIRSTVLTVDSGTPSVPVYFDFEAAWTKFAGLSGTLAYPTPISGVADDTWKMSHTEPLTSERQIACLLSRRGFEIDPDSRIRPGPQPLPRPYRRLISEGKIVYRTFPELMRIPSFRGQRFESVVFVLGNIRPPGTPDSLFQALVQLAGVSPFLYVTNGPRVLLAGLTTAPSKPPAISAGKLPMILVLKMFLQSIETWRFVLQSVRPAVDHRYEWVCETK